jgi:hypothetical protein
MKTTQIRQNCFETNSSSTHAFTLYVPSNVEISYKPYSETGKIIIPLGNIGGDDTFMDKMIMLGRYLQIQKKFDDLHVIEKVVSEFSGIDVKYDTEYFSPTLRYNGEEYSDEDHAIEDQFYTFLSGDRYGYGNGSVSNIREILDGILSSGSDKSILEFVCSFGWISCDTYYDG